MSNTSGSQDPMNPKPSEWYHTEHGVLIRIKSYSRPNVVFFAAYSDGKKNESGVKSIVEWRESVVRTNLRPGKNGAGGDGEGEG
jgi:hypothetical protein